MRTNETLVQSFALCVLMKSPWVTAGRSPSFCFAQKNCDAETEWKKPQHNFRLTRPAHEMVASDEHNRIGDNGLRRNSFVDAVFAFLFCEYAVGSHSDALSH